MEAYKKEMEEYKKENSTLAADPQSWCVFCIDDDHVQVVLLNMASFLINGARGPFAFCFCIFPHFLFNNVAML